MTPTIVGAVAAAGVALVSGLSLEGRAQLRDGHVVERHAQVHGGLRVLGRGTTVRRDAAGRVLQTTSRLETDLPASVVPAIDAAGGVAAAQKWLRVRATAADARLAIAPAMGGARLVWAVAPRVPRGLPTSPRVLVDAQTGEVLEARDAVRFANLAKVFAKNPAETPTRTFLPLKIAPSAATPQHLGAANGDTLRSVGCVDRHTTTDVDFGTGPVPIHLCELDQSAVADSNGDFDYPAHDQGFDTASREDTFAEVSIYYHAARAYQFFRDLRADANARVVQDAQLVAIANLRFPKGLFDGNLTLAGDKNGELAPFQNAFFAPGAGGLGELFGVTTGGLWFGQGPQRDYAYDGEVVYHELTHAVVDATLKLREWHLDAQGVTDAPGAMNEGLADYFSSAISGDPDLGAYAVGDVDPTGQYIRTLANDDRCPANLVGEVHYDSTMFSGALWSVRTTLAPEDEPKYDAAIYEAMLASPGEGDLGFEDFAKLVGDVLATDLPSAKPLFDTEMARRKLAPACARVLHYEGRSIVAPRGGESPGRFAAPGPRSIRPSLTLAPGLVQIEADVAQGSKGVRIGFQGLPWIDSSFGQLGNGGPEFTPSVLVKWDAPIQWKRTGTALSHDADAVLQPNGGTGQSQFFQTRIDLKEGAKKVYVQIANQGGDGAWDDLDLTFEPVPRPRDAGAEPEPEAGVVLTPGPSAGGGGCTCVTSNETGPEAGSTWGPLAGAMAIALGLLRRRRRAADGDL